MTRPTCKDCAGHGLPLTRKAPFPGPRCATHHRDKRKAGRDTAWARRLMVTYNITVDRYMEIHAVQGGVCAICERAKGTVKRLAVDHDHACCDGPISCGNCVRGLLCSTCNKTLGHLRDDPLAWERGADYLRRWPSKR